MTSVSRCLGASCPVTALVSQGNIWDADAVLAAAQARLAGDPSRSREVGRILRHVLLSHPLDKRFQVAQALARLTPGEASSAAAEVRRLLVGRNPEPSTGEALRYRVLLGLLGDPSQDRAGLDAAVAGAGDEDFLAVAVDYGKLGPEQGQLAATRLAALVRAGIQPPAKGYWPLLQLGPAFQPLLRAVLNEIVDAGTPLHLLVGSAAVRAAGFVDDAAALALRSLPLDPGSAIRRRHHREDDVVTHILACGEHYRRPALLALSATAANADLSDDHRWRAAYRAADLDPEAFDEIAVSLRDAGVADPTAGPLPPVLSAAEAEGIRERVFEAWQRIREQIRTRYPGFPIHFGPGATVQEIAALEAELGFVLPVESAASLAVHREVRFDGLIFGMCAHVDISMMSEMRSSGLDWDEGTQRCPEIRGEYGWRPGWIPLDCRDGDFDVLDLDPAPAGQYGQIVRISHDSWPGVHAPSWLAMLERVADDMIADRYLVEDDGRVLWQRQ